MKNACVEDAKSLLRSILVGSYGAFGVEDG
jgi:hypothetical protein